MKLLNWFRENYGLAVLLCIAAVLRFYHIDHQSVWLDEIYSLRGADPHLSLSGVYDSLLATEVQPPLYFVLLHYIFLIFGYSSFVLKMFSAVIGIAGVFGIYLLGKELIDKKTGLYAAILLTVNFFHLSYSQEGRMYSLLFLLTIFSFYFLVRLLKQPSARSAVVYGVFSALMIHCHFFSLFTLCAQWLILLFYIIKPVNILRKRFFFYCVLSVVTTVILFLPALPLLKKTASITSSWISLPGRDVYTELFKDFFGQAELVIFFILILLVAYFVGLFKETNTGKLQVDPVGNKPVFTTVLLFSWIFITLLLPLIRTYTSLPMLISRYFINILPAILLIAAIGLSSIGNRMLRYGIVSLIIVFSLTDIFFVKDYFNKVSKTQFREVSNFIIDHHLQPDPVVSSVGWFFTYFLDNKKTKATVIDKPLESHVAEMMKDSSKIRSFWYADAHNRPLNIPDSTREFLDAHFVVDLNTDKHDAWAKHYSTTVAAIQEEDISRFNDVAKNSGGYKYYIDLFNADSSTLAVTGFAYFYGQDADSTSIKLLLIGNGKAFRIASQSMSRNDVTINDHSKYDLGNSGFTTKTGLTKLEPGKYQLALLMKNRVTNKEELVLCDNFVDR
jgi:mannosyltransferase